MKFVLLTMLVALSPCILAAKATATFGGGCFWCMEAPFEKLKGVNSVVSGYMGGAKESPSYQEVSSGSSGHVEVVQVTYDNSLVSYEELLEIYWQNIDPTDSGGQFADRGSQYRTVIFYESEKQKQIALNSKNNLEACKKYDKPIVTAIEKAHKFFPAEDYHQDYYKKNPIRYNAYKELSGRGGYIRDVASRPLKCEKKKLENKKDKVMYKKPDLNELKEKLSPLEFEVTQNDATERPFANKYWDNKEEGIYVDVVTGEPLFSSLDKYDSGSGWPAFTKPIDQKVVSMKQDNKLLMTRTEVRSSSGDSHLGHVFDDGPGPEGKRYCINSAAMRFIPKADLEKEGYGQYLSLFK